MNRITAPTVSRPESVARAAASLALTGALALAITLGWSDPAKAQAPLRFALAQSALGQQSLSVDGSIEAVRDTRVAAQVPGRITQLLVKAGDKVQAGQVLMNIDPSVAAQQVAGGQAQVAQAQALLVSAKAEMERTRRLFEQNYVSKAAVERAEAQFKAAAAQSSAMSAQAAATSAQAAYYTVRAPYAGWVAQVNVSVGDMATPGTPLVSVYDPSALRATVQWPESMVSRLDTAQAAVVEIPGAGEQAGVHVTVLPSLDAATHSATVRVDLGPQAASVLPGQFVRVRLALKAQASSGGNTPAASSRARVMVPAASVVERGELTGVYVIKADGRAQLRQIRLGRAQGDQVEILSGLAVGEKVALDVVAAAQSTH
jgi:multidrug efflux system membrane fusion protein